MPKNKVPMFNTMALIPEDELHRLQKTSHDQIISPEEVTAIKEKEREIKKYDPEIRVMAILSRAIDRLLTEEDPSMTPSDRAALISLAQDRYNKLKLATNPSQQGIADEEEEGEMHRATPAAVIPAAVIPAAAGIPAAAPGIPLAPGSPPPASPTGTAAPIDPFEDTSFNIPRIHKTKANIVIDYIKPEILHKNRAGELVVHNKAIPGSSYEDSMLSLFSKKKGLNLRGSPVFISALKELGVRANMITNSIAISKLAEKSPKHTPKRDILVAAAAAAGSHPPGTSPKVMRLYH